MIVALISLNKNKKGIALIIIASLLTSAGQLFWKLSGGENIVAVITGFVFYGLGAVLMIIAFRFGSLSVLHPMLSFSYIFAVILGFYVLKEPISLRQLLAIGVIITGVALIGGGDG